MDLVFKAPGKDAPGFLRRQREALRFQERIASGNLGAAVVDEMIALLLPYVEEPADKAAAAEALLDASEAQFTDMLKAITGGSVNPTPETSPE
jgi:hypothetical protein